MTAAMKYLAHPRNDMRTKLTEAEIAARRVNRDPCPYCNTRRDIGCRHIGVPA